MGADEEVGKKMLRNIIGLLLIASLWAGVFPAGAQGGFDARTSNNRLNVRNGPGSYYVQVAELAPRTPVLLHARSESAAWLEVSTRDESVRGWVYARYLTLEPGVEVAALPVLSGGIAEGDPAVQTTAPLRLREGPGTNYGYITLLPEKLWLVAEGRFDGTNWILARTPDGILRGWLSAAYLDFSTDPEALPLSSEVIVQEAPPETPQAPEEGAVPPVNVTALTTAVLRVRSGPGTDYTTLTAVNEGEELILEARSAGNGWALGYNNEVRGWFFVEYLVVDGDFQALPVSDAVISEEEAVPPESSDEPDGETEEDGESEPEVPAFEGTLSANVTNNLRMRSGSDVRYRTITVIPARSIVELEARSSSGLWALGTLPDEGVRGWLYTEYLRVEGELMALPVSDEVIEQQPADSDASIDSGESVDYDALLESATTAVLRVRSGPGTGYRTIMAMDDGDPFYIEARDASAEWALGFTEGDVRGWTAVEYLTVEGDIDAVPISDEIITNTPEVDAPAELTLESTTTAVLRVRTGPGTGYTTIDAIPDGGAFTIEARDISGEWALGSTPDGLRGWCAAEFLSIEGVLSTLAVSDEIVPRPEVSAPTGQSEAASTEAAPTPEEEEKNESAPPIDPTPPPQQGGPGTITAATVSNLRLRTGPSTRRATIDVIAINAIFIMQGRDWGGKWAFGMTQDGSQGWVAEEYLEYQGDIMSLPFINDTAPLSPGGEDDGVSPIIVGTDSGD
jgi:uncharacterized protein YraI